MAFTATDVRLSDRAMHLFAISTDLYAALKQGRNRPGHGSMQLKEFTGIRLQYAGDGARLT